MTSSHKINGELKIKKNDLINKIMDNVKKTESILNISLQEFFCVRAKLLHGLNTYVFWGTPQAVNMLKLKQ